MPAPRKAPDVSVTADTVSDICVFGAGGVGSYLAAKLGQTGRCNISVIGRGAHLDAIASRGLELISEEGATRISGITAAPRARDLPRQDIVFVTVKAHDLTPIAEELRDLIKPDGALVFVNNGIPWWWNHGLPGDGGPLQQVDPGSRLWNIIGPQRAIGCVLYSANSISAPGQVTHHANNQWLLAEPTNQKTARVEQVVALMRASGLNAEIPDDLRQHIWKKLMRNAPFNTLCALSRLPAGDFVMAPGLVDIAQAMMNEVASVAAAMGWQMPMGHAPDIVESGGRMHSADGPTSELIPSMLQDALLGRPMEVDTILGQVHAFALEANVPTPTLAVVLPILKGLNASLQAQKSR